MKKINVMMILWVGILIGACYWTEVNAKADDNSTPGQNQVIKDEGYGNDDAEYYGSKDDLVNDEEPVDSQENVVTNTPS